jgi:hypothetical protein
MRKGASEHVLHYDGSLKGLATCCLSKNAQLQAIANSSCLCSFHFVVLITKAKPYQNSV